MATTNYDAAQSAAQSFNPSALDSTFPGSAPALGKYEYRPSDKTFEALEKLPWSKLEDQLGLKKEMFYTKEGATFKSKWKMEGILEALAYGRFTSYPLPIILKVGDLRPMHTSATVQVSFNKVKNDFEFDIHPVNGFKFVLDKDGNRQIRENRMTGEPEYVTEFNKNPILENDSLSLFGKQLTPVEVENLRQTGNMGSLFTTPSGRQLYVSVDPFNNHSLCYAAAEYVSKIITSQPSFKYKGQTYEFSQSELSSLLKGRSVKLLDSEGKPFNIQFNAVKGKLTLAPFFKTGLRQDQARSEQQNQQASRTQTQAKAPSFGFGDFR